MADSKIKVITVTSDPNNQGVHNLIGSLTMFGWDFQVIPCVWHGFGTKIIKTYEYLKDHPEIEHFIFCDANDVVVLATEAEFIAKLDGWEGCLFSAERNCWPDAHLADEFNKYDHGFNYLNSGLYYMPTKLFLNIVEHFYPKYEDDDQRYFTSIFIDSRDIMLDNNCDFFQCYSFIKDEDYQYTLDGRLYNNWTKTFPVFIHGNGRTDMTKVLELLK